MSSGASSNPAAAATARATAQATKTAQPGPYRVARSHIETAGGGYDLFRPVSYPGLGFLSPIVTWGNGTGSAPGDYRTLLSHLASWGFTVIASTLPNTGSGRELLAGARYLVAEDARPGSPFHRRLDTREIAAMGHSQGATGAVRAAELGGSLISTVITFSLPWNGSGPVSSFWDRPSSLGWSGANADCPKATDCWADPLAVRQPTFVVSTRGPIDGVIAPPGVERCYFEDVHGPAALGLVRQSAGRTADHLTVRDRRLGGSPNGLLGYVTDWLLAHLRHDAAAATAFSGRRPLLLGDPDWAGSAVKAGWSGDSGCG